MSTRAILLLYVATVLTVGACRRENVPAEQGVEPGATVRTVTTTVPPQDLSKARVDAVIPPAEDVYVERARLGSSLGDDGMVATETTEFAKGDQVYLSMWFRESPRGLQSSVVLAGADGEEIGRGQRDLQGQKSVTFPVGDKNLEPGKYKVTGYWGGNIAAEYDFVVK